MTISPKKTREAVLQCLFSFEGGGDEEGLISLLMHELKTSRRFIMEALEYARRIWKLCPEIDKKIENISVSYDWRRVGKVEKSVLRLGAFEIFEQKLALEIVISEALRLTSKFSTPEGAHFVHAILDTLGKNSSPSLSS
jgi:N utilization substance protein B